MTRKGLTRRKTKLSTNINQRNEIHFEKSSSLTFPSQLKWKLNSRLPFLSWLEDASVLADLSLETFWENFKIGFLLTSKSLGFPRRRLVWWNLHGNSRNSGEEEINTFGPLRSAMLSCKVSSVWYTETSSTSFERSIAQSLYSCNTTIQIYRCREIRNTDDSQLFRYKTFINFLTFSFLTRGERDTIFTMLTVPTSPTVNPPAGLARPGPESNLN